MAEPSASPQPSPQPQGELTCWNCDASLAELPRPITRHMNCPACYEDLHCCRMCRHFIDNATNPCADERAEPPTHKEGANFCDYFRPAVGRYRTGANERQQVAKSRLGALFDEPQDEAAASDAGNEPSAEASEEDAARRRLDELFR